LTLSNGKLIEAAKAPEIILAMKNVQPGEKCLPNLSFASSYDASIPKFKDIALTTVGAHPFQQLKIPSSLIIVLNASITFL
jgi:hypothetical protein